MMNIDDDFDISEEQLCEAMEEEMRREYEQMRTEDAECWKA